MRTQGVGLLPLLVLILAKINLSRISFFSLKELFMEDCIFDKAGEMRQLMDGFICHRKKIAALERFSVSAVFKDREELELLKGCLKKAFLSEKKAAFLDEMVEEYQSKGMKDYLFWSYKTKSLKQEMEAIVRPVQAPQLTFAFAEPKIPLHLLDNVKNRQIQRAS
jgi:hypothetical protein